jgi:hypothetical protein
MKIRVEFLKKRNHDRRIIDETLFLNVVYRFFIVVVCFDRFFHTKNVFLEINLFIAKIFLILSISHVSKTIQINEFEFIRENSHDHFLRESRKTKR